MHENIIKNMKFIPNNYPVLVYYIVVIILILIYFSWFKCARIRLFEKGIREVEIRTKYKITNNKKALNKLRAFLLFCGLDGIRTRDPMRDRHVF